MNINNLYLDDCINFMSEMGDGTVDLTLTDIPYDGVNRKSNGLRKLDKENADIITFDLDKFLEEIYRVTKSTCIVFCGYGQFSKIYDFFKNKSSKSGGTVRQIVWQKSNPSPMNGQFIYLSGIENAIWFKKKGGTFNAHCKNPVFKYPNGSSKIHPTEKNHKLLEELILDNSNENDIVFDACAGSGAHLLVAKKLNRKYIGCELNENYYQKALERLV